MATLDIKFPGSIARVPSAAVLRQVPSSSGLSNNLFLVGIGASSPLFQYLPTSLAVDNGTTVIKPNDLTALQFGRWILDPKGFTAGSPGQQGNPGTNGTNGANGVNGGVGSSAGFAAVVGAASGMTIGPDITMVKFAGYYEAGDGGGGDYVRAKVPGVVAGDNVNIPNSVKFYASGYWWFLDLSSGFIDIRQAGAKSGAQYNTSNGTVTGFDCWQAINDAINSITYLEDQSFYPAGYPSGGVVYTGLGKYRVSQAINLKRRIILRGLSTGAEDFTYGSSWFFPNGTDGIIINQRNTSGHGGAAADTTASQGTEIDGMSIFHVGDIGERQYTGIRAHQRCKIVNTFVYWDSGDAFDVTAQAGGGGTIEGNTNGSFYDNLYARCTGYGWKATQKDSNASYLGRIQIRSAGYGGLLDFNTLGNFYGSIQVDQCSTNVDNGYCTYQGGRYMLTDVTPGIGGATTPGTNDAIWYPEESYQSYPARREWASGMSFVYSAAIGIKGTANTSFIGNVYTESYLCDASGSNATGGSGQTTWTRGSNMQGVNGYGTYYSTAPKDPMSSGVGLADSVNLSFGRGFQDGPTLYSAMRGVDNGAGFRRRYVGRDLVRDNGSASPVRYGLETGRYTEFMAGGVVPLPYYDVVDRLVLGDLADDSNARAGSRPISPGAPQAGGVSMRGHFKWNPSPTVRAASGTISTGGAITNDPWVANQVYLPLSALVKNNGRSYVGTFAPSWATGQAIAVGDMRSSYGVNYKATQGGTTGPRGPVGFQPLFADNNVRWAPVEFATSGNAGGPNGTSVTPQRDGDMWWIYQPPFVELPTGILGAVPAAFISPAAGAAPTKQEFDALVAALIAANLMQPQP